MKTYAVQLDIAWERKSPNHQRVRALLEAARPDEGSLVVLPEMFATGFSMNVDAIDDGEKGETRDFLADLAARFRVHLVAGIVTRNPDGSGNNLSLLLDPTGTETARYSKIHPFSMAGEKDHYQAGNSVVVTECCGFKLAPFICYDLRFPEIFRSAAARGANLFTLIANWPVARVDHWITLLRARAIENQAYVVGVNRAGSDPMLVYPGRSLIVDPKGAILADAGDLEHVISAEADPQIVEEYRKSFPILADIRPEYVSIE